MKFTDIFATPARLRAVLLSTALACFVLLLVALVMRVHAAGSQGGTAAVGSATPTARPVNTALIPPSPVTASPTPQAPDYGDAGPILLEAIHSWLGNDRRTFAKLASDEAAELVFDAPAPRPGQKILSDPELIEPGPTQATYRIRVSDGLLQVVMAVDHTKLRTGWVVDDMEYVR